MLLEGNYWEKVGKTDGCREVAIVAVTLGIESVCSCDPYHERSPHDTVISLGTALPH